MGWKGEAYVYLALRYKIGPGVCDDVGFAFSGGGWRYRGTGRRNDYQSYGYSDL